MNPRAGHDRPRWAAGGDLPSPKAAGFSEDRSADLVGNLDRTNSARRSSPPRLGPPGAHALISLLTLNGLSVTEATNSDVQAWA